VLKSLVTSHWNNFSVTQHVTIRDYLLKYLAEKGPTLPVFVLTALLSLLARLTKLGWFDDPKHRDIVSEVTKFLTASIDHCGVGLRALNCLVEEFNVPVSGRTLTHHRKTAVSFRDAGLFECFELGIGMLQQLASDQLSGCTPPQRSLLGDQALLLLIKCLSYDFIGTNPDESGDDVGTIQLPSSWREAVAAPTTMELLLQLYSSAEPPLSAHAMECVVLLSSVRRSLFRTEGERGQHLNRIMTAIGDVLRGGTGLGHSENYHEFCRLLGRLKANYQLSELMNSSGFSEWLELVTTFTEQSCRQWQVAANSLQYLLALWVRLVAAVPYVSTDDSHSSSSGGGGSGSYASYRSSYPPGGTPHVIGSAISDRGASSSASSGGAGAGGGGAAPESATTLAVRQLEACIERVVAAYVEGLLSAVRTCAADDTLDDPLEDTEQVDEQLQRLPSIFRYRYEPSAAFLVSRMDPLLASYQQVVQGNEAAAVAVATAAATSGVAGGAGGSPSEAVELLENELAWLVGVCGAVVGGLSWSSSLVVGHEALDGQLAKRCFACAQMVNFKAEQSQGSQCCTERLELALLNFLSHFRRVYLADAAAASLPTAAASAGGASSSSTSGAMAAAYSASQTLQALGTPLSALAWDAEHEDGTTGPMTVKQRAVRSMLAAMEQVFE
jgi:exportin-7